MSTEKIQLVLDVTGVEDVAKLKERMKELADALGVMDAKFKTLDGTAAQAEDSLGDMAERIDALNGKLDELDNNAGGITPAMDTVVDATDKATDSLDKTASPLETAIELFGNLAGPLATAAAGATMLYQAWEVIGPMLDETETPLKDLGETLDEFASGMGARGVEVERLANSIKELSKALKEDWTSSSEERTKQADQIIEQARELEAEKKQNARDAKDIKAGSDMFDALDGKDEERGKLFKEYVTGLDDSMRKALREKLMEENSAKALDFATDEIMAARDRSGEFNQGSAEYNDFLRQRARKQVRDEVANSPEALERARRDLAARQLGRAMDGDSVELDNIQTADSDFDQFMKDTEFDKEFQKSLDKRKEAIVERNKKQAESNAAAQSLIDDTSAFFREEDAATKRIQGTGPTRQMFEQNMLRQQEAEARAGQQFQQRRFQANSRGIDGLTKEGIDPIVMEMLARQRAGALDFAPVGPRGQMVDRETRLRMARAGVQSDVANQLQRGGMNRDDAAAQASMMAQQGVEQFGQAARGQNQNVNTMMGITNTLVNVGRQMSAQQKMQFQQMQRLQMQVNQLQQSVGMGQAPAHGFQGVRNGR